MRLKWRDGEEVDCDTGGIVAKGGVRGKRNYVEEQQESFDRGPTEIEEEVQEEGDRRGVRL